MAYLMTAKTFADKAENIAKNYKTSYMLGPWGWPANAKMINRTITQGSNIALNKTWLSYAYAIQDKGFLFDCVGLIKGILWGWSGDMSKTYGGAGYACNGVPDWGADTMIRQCKEVSTNFTKIVRGEAVWMEGHIGIYLGNGIVAEATPRWKWGVQLSTCTNISAKQISGTVGTRKWTSHGKLPWVDYSVTDNTKTEEEDDDVVRYRTKNDIPENSHFRDIIDDIMTAGIMGGDGSDPVGNNDVIDLSHDMVRIIVLNYRAGVYDKALDACGLGRRWK